jgi:hypothetical protein
MHSEVLPGLERKINQKKTCPEKIRKKKPNQVRDFF